jgi:hypothetical protein
MGVQARGVSRGARRARDGPGTLRQRSRNRRGQRPQDTQACGGRRRAAAPGSSCSMRAVVVTFTLSGGARLFQPPVREWTLHQPISPSSEGFKEGFKGPVKASRKQSLAVRTPCRPSGGARPRGMLQCSRCLEPAGRGRRRAVRGFGNGSDKRGVGRLPTRRRPRHEAPRRGRRRAPLRRKASPGGNEGGSGGGSLAGLAVLRSNSRTKTAPDSRGSGSGGRRDLFRPRAEPLERDVARDGREAPGERVECLQVRAAR